jgi:hypothetical protein
MRFNFLVEIYFSQNGEGNGLEDKGPFSSSISQNISTESQLQTVNRLSFPPPQEGFFANFYTQISMNTVSLTESPATQNSQTHINRQRHQMSPAINALFTRRLAMKKDKQLTNQENGGNEKGFS